MSKKDFWQAFVGLYKCSCVPTKDKTWLTLVLQPRKHSLLSIKKRTNRITNLEKRCLWSLSVWDSVMMSFAEAALTKMNTRTPSICHKILDTLKNFQITQKLTCWTTLRLQRFFSLGYHNGYYGYTILICVNPFS